MVNYKTLYSNLYGVISPLIAPIDLIIDTQSDIKPSNKYCTIRISDMEEIGYPQERETDGDGNAEIHRVYKLTLRFMMIGKDSQTSAAVLHSYLMKPSVQEALAAIDLDFFQRGNLHDAPRLLSTGYEERTTFDMHYYIRIVDTDYTNYISSIELETKIVNADDTVVMDFTDTITQP